MSQFVDRLAHQLAASSTVTPASAAPPGGRRAAVAAVLHDDGDGTRVLLMERAERVGDPWSGHISLPGGGYHASDVSLLETAIRETREELGIELGGSRLLGHLPTMHPRTSGPVGIEVTPFVFVTEVALTPVCGPEARSAFWLPLALAASGSLDGTYAYPIPAMTESSEARSTMTFPSWTYEGHVIWGLTWRILGDLLEAGRD